MVDWLHNFREFFVKVEAQWNVNGRYKMRFTLSEDVKVEAQWNVNYKNKRGITIKLTVKVEAQWNVN